MKIGKIPVKIVDSLKQIFKLHTYQVEFLFVAIVLMLVVIFAGNHTIVEWIGAAAVFITFAHAKVANRLAEREAYRQKTSPDPSILSYHYKIGRYFILKEMLWFTYFILLGAWSALAGVIIFLLYEPWRKLWRRYHPLEEKLKISSIFQNPD